MRTNFGRAAMIAILASLLVAYGSPRCLAETPSLHLSGDEYWGVLASRKEADEAIGVARYYHFVRPDIRVIRSKNSWFAVVFGPIHAADIQTAKAALNKNGSLPRDFYVSRGAAYVETIWQAKSPPFLGSISLSENSPRVMSYEGLTVSISAEPSSKSSSIPVVTGSYRGLYAFKVTIPKAA